jgi:hypothetical protein
MAHHLGKDFVRAIASSMFETDGLEPRQFDLMGIANTLVPPMDPFATINLPSEYGKEAVHERVIWGPFQAKPANVRINAFSKPESIVNARVGHSRKWIIS